MAFLKARAERYFFDVYVEWDRLHFQFPRPQLAAHVLEWGTQPVELHRRGSPAAGLAGLAGDPRVQPGAGPEHLRGRARGGPRLRTTCSSGSAARRIDLLTLARPQGDPQAVDRATRCDAAELAKSLLADLLGGLYEGPGSCVGIPDLAAGQLRRDPRRRPALRGTYRVRKVTHRIDANGFAHRLRRSARRGHSSLLGMLRKQTSRSPRPNRPRAVLRRRRRPRSSTTTSSRRCRRSCRWAGSRSSSPACRRQRRERLGAVRAADGREPTAGFYALPDEGDQVLVAFENGDCRKPYVLGASVDAPSSGPPAHEPRRPRTASW